MALCAGLLSGTGAFADDTEIYIGLNQGQSVAKPNVLFILDTSGSMGTGVFTTPPSTRLKRMTAIAIPTRSSGRPTERRRTLTATTLKNGSTRPSSDVKPPQAHWAPVVRVSTPTNLRVGSRAAQKLGDS